MLTAYITEVQELLHDPNATYFSTTDLTNYINRARNRIAARSQSIRLLLSGGTIIALAITSGGTFANNGAATVTVNGAGQQGTATGVISGGTLTSITLTNGGWGYVTGTATSITVTDPTGAAPSVAPTFTITIDNSLTTVPVQEVYQFATAATLAQNQTLLPGVQSIIGVFSVACAWGANAAMKPLLKPVVWTDFQAYYRSYNTGMQNFPTVWAQYRSGVAGSIYLWELPSQASQMDWDCWCLPVTLTADSIPEALDYPWTSPVAYYAAYLAYFNAQRFDSAEKLKQEYDDRMMQAGQMTQAPFVPDYYASDF
jgi:hypothetical protein